MTELIRSSQMPQIRQAGLSRRQRRLDQGLQVIDDRAELSIAEARAFADVQTARQMELGNLAIHSMAVTVAVHSAAARFAQGDPFLTDVLRRRLDAHDIGQDLIMNNVMRRFAR